MIVFEKISLKNFLSFGAAVTVIELDKPGTTLILGEDMDNTDKGAGGNGCGKTTIINALVYALYDKPLSNISKDRLINNTNKKNMVVTIDFTKGDDQYSVHRARKTKAGASGNWVKLFCNGDDITLDSIANTNTAIENILGLPFELFIRICAVSANHVPFLDLPVRHASMANQTDIIEELFDLKTLTEKADLLKVAIKDTQRSRDIQIERSEALQREHDRYNKLLASARSKVDAWQRSTDAQVVKLTNQLQQLRTIDIDQQKTAITESDSIKQQLSEATTDYNNHVKAAGKLQKVLDDLTKQLEHLDDGTCPYCLQTYAEAAEKRKAIGIEHGELEQQFDELATIVEEKHQLMTQYNEQYKKVQGIIVIDDLDELYDISGQIVHIEQQLDDIANSSNPMQSTVDELLAEKLDPIDNTDSNKLTTLLDHQKFLLKLLTKKDSFVRKTLLEKNIPFLNKRLSRYLKELGLPHAVLFTHEMTADISQFGRTLDFGNLSNGQQARVNIALSFAFRDVLQTIHERINVCMLDEILDVGLDTVGIQAATGMLKGKARDEGLSMFIISHRDEAITAFDRTMTVQMSKGFSYIGEILD